MNFNHDSGKQAQEVYSVENYSKYHILSCFLAIQMLRKQILKNILEWH